MNSSTPLMNPSELRRSVRLFEVKPGTQFSVATLEHLLPNVETALFFGKAYSLDAKQMAALLHQLFKSDLTDALFGEGAMHSSDLQDYLLDGYYDEWGNWVDPLSANLVHEGDIVFDPDVPTGEILPEVWKSLEVEIADSIKDVAAKLSSVVSMLPGKQGSMIFSSMMKLNAKRPTIGDFKAKIHHAPQKENLVILDVSGSMTQNTVQRIIDDVVSLSYMANAALAVVSNTTTFWEPGSYDVDCVLAECEYGGTHYETLLPLFQGRDWGVVVTVADYDSSPAAKTALTQASGRIDQVLDISLVDRPTYLAECVGQLATEVRPLLVGSSMYVTR